MDTLNKDIHVAQWLSNIFFIITYSKKYILYQKTMHMYTQTQKCIFHNDLSYLIICSTFYFSYFVLFVFVLFYPIPSH